MKRAFFFCLLLVLTSIFIFYPIRISAHETGNQEKQKVFIHMIEGGFEPEDIELEVGTKVVFENLDNKPRWPASNIHPIHQIYPEFDPKASISPGESWELTFQKKGAWRYHDHLSPQLTGVITVVEAENGGVDTRFLNEIFSYITTLINKISSVFLGKDLIAKDKSYLENASNEYNFIEVNEDTADIFENDDVLYSYIKKYGPLKTTKHLASLSTSFGDCHNRAHEAGRIAFEIYGAQAFQTCSAECHSGCYHGATEAFFREKGTNSLQENISTICSSDLNPFFSHQCIHGIGHGLMAYFDYEIHEAIEACNLLQEGQNSCYSGVFMENVVGGLAEGHFTKYLSDDPHYPCTDIEDKYKNDCYFYQTSRMLHLFAGDFSKVAEACSEVDEAYQNACFASMGRDVGGAHRLNIKAAIQACSEAPYGAKRNLCLTGAVQDYFWDPSGQDSALEFCSLLVIQSEKEACYETIIERASQVLEKGEQMSAFCEKFEDDFKDSCRGYTDGI